MPGIQQNTVLCLEYSNVPRAARPVLYECNDMEQADMQACSAGNVNVKVYSA